MDYAKIREFYNCLQDEESRYIFMCRWQYLISGDESYLEKMVKGTDKYFHRRVFHKSPIVKQLYSKPDKNDFPVILYGTGGVSETVLNELRQNSINPVAFCDSSTAKAGKFHLGLPVISKDSLLDGTYKSCRVVVSTWKYQAEICTELVNAGFPLDRLYTFLDSQYDYGLQYFGPNFMQPSSNEVFVDGGAFDGGTIRDFVKYTRGSYKHIYAFEPHPNSYIELKNNISNWGVERITLIEKAVWSCNDVLEFAVAQGPIAAQGSHVINTASNNAAHQKIKAESIDAILKNEKVTFIKLDVEGTELEALKGAEKTIIRNKPKLAICIYHKPEDIVDISLFILNQRLDYKFWIRHHNYLQNPHGPYAETVLYAV